jgi:hypothetical protein
MRNLRSGVAGAGKRTGIQRRDRRFSAEAVPKSLCLHATDSVQRQVGPATHAWIRTGDVAVGLPMSN